MTVIDSLVRPAPQRLGVHSLDHFCLTVPDLEEGRRFYTAFGLDVRERDGTLGLFTDGSDHCWGVLCEGDAKSLHHVSFGAFADELPSLAKRLQDNGVARIDPPKGFAGDGIWFRDVDGNLVEIRPAAKSSPYEKAVVHNPSSAPGVRGAPIRGQTAMVRPRRLAHILLFSSNLARSKAFYIDLMGLRLSDDAEVVAFLHGIHGSDHHMIAFAQSDAPGFHHVSWDIESFHEVGLGAQQMADAGYRAGWGVGRHVLGSNYFHYVRDPWGSYCEYSSDIDYIPETMIWQEGYFSPDNGFYLWGPKPPEDFAANYESPFLVRRTS
jgi:catechol 2,3-dioxygenase-like lactoylglutathione lyase family enzyme